MYFYAGIDDLYDIKRELSNVAHKWKDIGLALRLHPDKLKTIQADCRDCKSCLCEVLSEWLKKSYNTTRTSGVHLHHRATTTSIREVSDVAGGRHADMLQAKNRELANNT